MDLLRELENLEQKEDLIEELKKEELPLVMWGAGELAEEINHYLKKRGMVLSDVFVDDEYYSKDKVFDQKPVISYTMLTEKYAAVNVIMGSSNYEKAKILEAKKNIHKVFYMFSVNYGIYEKTSMDEIKDHIDEFHMAYQLLADETSRRSYLALLKTRLSGNNSYILELYEKESNFFNNEIFRIHDEEVLLDIGAYDGDTIRLFLKENKGRYRHIYALEPDDANRCRLESYICENHLENITVTEKGAWRENKKLYFSANNEQISSILMTDSDESCKENVGIMAETLDEMFDYPEKVTMLKINYLEGVKEALQGAEHILKVHQPKLAITVGFDCRNIRAVPILIKQMNPDYEIYLRYNRGMVSSLTCYGIIS